MDKSINKYGLKRYIPSDIREKIRRDSSFGCVICGCVLVDYEHIHPEFHDAKEHDPNCMTLLCLSCHGRVTRKLISKNAVWEAKASPKALQNGYVHDLLYVNTSEMEIKIGNSRTKNTKIILVINGKPIIWFEPPLLKDEPSKICAIFCDENGNAISYINRNQFKAFSNSQDIKSESTKLSIRSKGIKCLEIDREGGEVLYVSKLQGSYLGTSVSLDKDGKLIIKQGSSTSILGEFYAENCGSAIHIGEIPKTIENNRVFSAIMLAKNHNVISILNLKNKIVGWIFNDKIFNKSYEIVGFTKKNKVFNIANEYIGDFNKRYITYTDDCYENGEPIFVSKENRVFRNKNPDIGYDMSFRLFELS